MLTPEREADLRRLVAPSEIFKHTGISTALTDLLSEIDRLRAENAALREEIDEVTQNKEDWVEFAVHLEAQRDALREANPGAGGALLGPSDGVRPEQTPLSPEAQVRPSDDENPGKAHR